ncbi:MAG: hypothetical protein HOP11_11680 [Saprospiraceae bacterium]|nr:hypothetical protein [Saprospiraceae bacterium]
MKVNLTIIPPVILLLFSNLVDSCSYKESTINCCTINSSQCCDSVKNMAPLTGNIESESGYVNADIAIDTAYIEWTVVKEEIIFHSRIHNNIGDDCTITSSGIILLPPNADVLSVLIETYKEDEQGVISKQEINNWYQCGARIQFCTDLSLCHNKKDKIKIEVKLKKSAHLIAKCKGVFGIFIYNQAPDLSLDNNYWYKSIDFCSINEQN